MDERTPAFALPNTDRRTRTDVWDGYLRAFQVGAVRYYNESFVAALSHNNRIRVHFPDCRPYSLLFFGKRVYVNFLPVLPFYHQPDRLRTGILGLQRRHYSLPQVKGPPFPSSY